MTVLTYVTLICRGLDGLAGFYVLLLGLEGSVFRISAAAPAAQPDMHP